MAKNKTNRQENNSFTKRIPLIRKLVFIIGFLVIIPIVVFTTLYVSTFVRTTRVEFTSNGQVQATETRHFHGAQVIATGQNNDSFTFDTGNITVTITLISKTDAPSVNSLDAITYRFDIVVAINEGRSVNGSINVSLILQASWQDARSSQINRTIAQTNLASRNIDINFDHTMHSNLWFVNQTAPILYVQVGYQTPGPISPVTQNYFASGRMDSLTPYVTLPEEE